MKDWADEASWQKIQRLEAEVKGLRASVEHQETRAVTAESKLSSLIGENAQLQGKCDGLVHVAAQYAQERDSALLRLSQSEKDVIAQSALVDKYSAEVEALSTRLGNAERERDGYYGAMCSAQSRLEEERIAFWDRESDLRKQVENREARLKASSERLDKLTLLCRELEFFLRGHPGEASVLRSKIKSMIDVERLNTSTGENK